MHWQQLKDIAKADHLWVVIRLPATGLLLTARLSALTDFRNLVHFSIENLNDPDWIVVLQAWPVAHSCQMQVPQKAYKAFLGLTYWST